MTQIIAAIRYVFQAISAALGMAHDVQERKAGQDAAAVAVQAETIKDQQEEIQARQRVADQQASQVKEGEARREELRRDPNAIWRKP